MRLQTSVAASVFFAIFACHAGAAQFVAAHPGSLGFTEGDVYLSEKGIDLRSGHIPMMKENEVLRTERGRAEVLLTPGAYLRVDRDSSVRLLSGSLTDTHLELQSGTAIVEVDQLRKENRIRVDLEGKTVQLKKKGLYRFDANRGLVEVRKGEALAESEEKPVKIKGNHVLALTSGTVSKLESDTQDEFDRWSKLRASYLESQNRSTAPLVYARPYGFGWGSPYWGWNPYGFSYWSPGYLYSYPAPRFYRPRPVPARPFRPMRPPFRRHR